MSTTHHPTRTLALAGGAALALLLAACSSETEATASAAPLSPSVTPSTHDDHDEVPAQAAEHSSAMPRIALTYDGGVAVIDALTLETVAEFELSGFNRINALGDGRHVAISTEGGWAVLDAGTWREAHGDHAHYYTAEPELHDVMVPAQTPAHVVVHDGLTALFDDGTGDVTVVEAAEWTHMVEHGEVDAVRTYTTDAPHHGVAAVATDGTMLVTRGDEESRTGAMLLDGDDQVIVSSDQCPGVHGETVFTGADGETFWVTGCEDGALVFHGDHIHKLESPDEFGRIGNAFSTEGSNVVLGDYKNDPEAGIGLSAVTLIDVETDSISVTDPFDGADALYTWRGLARGHNGEALVLGTDGALRVLDPDTGDIVHTIDVVDAWEVPEEWQTPHPALMVLEGMAFVTDPATGMIHAVDYVEGSVWSSGEVGLEMNEIAGLTG